MVDSPAFRLWLRIETGRVAAFEANFQIPADQVKIEVRKDGRWTQVTHAELT